MKTIKQDPRIVNSLQRAIDIIGLFNIKNKSLSLTEISLKMHLPKSTTASLIYTLQKNDYLDQDPETRRYRLGLCLLERGALVSRSIEVGEIALPHLHNLQAMLDESVFVAIVRDFEFIVVNRLWGSSVLSVYTNIGEKIGLLNTATGLAILAGMTPEKAGNFLEEYYKRFPDKYDPENYNNLLQDVHSARLEGYAINLKGKIPGICYIGSAIKDFKGDPVAAIVMSIPIARISAEKIPEIGELVCETASAISVDIGYQIVEREHNAK